MRIRRLTFAGLGPFRAVQEIDFDALDDVGIYLIAGRTGAGKSTILDAVCFALYGSAPRFDGTASRLRSDHSLPEEDSFAELDFEAAGRLYRLRRSPEYDRPARRGGGTTRQPAKAVLLEHVGGEWCGVSSSAREIGSEVLRIVGLTKDQFLQVILLAQNRFHEFLLARNDDRQRLLRTLFATERFEQLTRLLVARRQEAEGALVEERAGLAALAHEAARTAGDDAAPTPPPELPDAAWFAHLLTALEPRAHDARRAAEAADAEHRAAREAFDDARRRHEAGERRARAEAEAAALAAQQPDIEAVGVALADARRAEAVAPLIAREGSALEALDGAHAAHESAAGAFTAATGLPAEEPIARDRAESLSASIGALAQALADESALPAARRSAEHAAAALGEVDTAIALLDDERRRLPQESAAIDDEIALLRPAAAEAPLRRAELDALATRHSAATALVEAEREHAEAQERFRDRADAHTRASARHSELVAARFAGFASELAAELRAGEPCAVCGSTTHPAPAAPHGAGAVGAAEIDRARSDVSGAAAAMDAAAGAERAASERVTALRAAAGGDGLDELETAVARAGAAEAVARASVASLADAEGRRRVVLAAIAAAESRSDSLRTQRDVLATAHASAAATLTDLTARVDAQRDGAPSIAARSRALDAERAIATALVSAAVLLRDRTAAADDLRRQVDAALAERGLADRAAASAAFLDARAIARAEAAVAAHERRRGAVEAALADPELTGLPRELEPLDGVRERLAAAASARDDALARRSALDAREDRLRRVVDLALSRLETLAERLRRYDELRGLAEAVDGRGPNTRRMDLEAFALAGRLEEIVAAANLRLDAMTSGRYALAHDDTLAYRGAASGLGIDVLDAFTGVRRQTTSLSGGETFLASLALALGLADVVTAQAGGVSLETMFIDEGFGSLDAETLEIAMSTLDSLRSGGRTVGLISHVDTMKERLPIGLRVEVTERGDSVLRTV